jgi:hypothetical protein
MGHYLLVLSLTPQKKTLAKRPNFLFFVVFWKGEGAELGFFVVPIKLSLYREKFNKI